MIKDFQKTAIVTATSEISFDEMLRRISMFADLTPATKGDRVLIFSENREAWIYSFFAVWAVGAIPVPVDAGNTVDDVAYILGNCTPRVVWTSRKREDTLREAVRHACVDTRVMLVDDYEHSPLTTQPQADIDYKDEDTAVIIYTSGTTGNPKGVMLSFANLMVNVRSVSEDLPIFHPGRRT